MKEDRHIIQKYLDQELSEKEMIRFEQDLEASPEMLADLNLFQEVDEAMADTDVLDFRAQLTDMREEKQRTETGRKFLRFTRSSITSPPASTNLLNKSLRVCLSIFEIPNFSFDLSILSCM